MQARVRRLIDMGLTRKTNKKEDDNRRTMSGMTRLMRLFHYLPPLTINNYPISLMISRGMHFGVELRPMASLIFSHPPPFPSTPLVNLCFSLFPSIRIQLDRNGLQAWHTARVHPRASGRSTYRFVVTFRRSGSGPFCPTLPITGGALMQPSEKITPMHRRHDGHTRYRSYRPMREKLIAKAQRRLLYNDQRQ